MWLAVELALHHYEPDTFTEDTLFMNVQFVGTEKEHVEVFPLGSVALELWEKHMLIPESFGYPVQPHLLDEKGIVIATPDEIGLFDNPHDEDEYEQFNWKHINIIMRDFDGLCEILVDPDELEQDNFIQPIYEKEQVIIRGLTENEEDSEV